MIFDKHANFFFAKKRFYQNRIMHPQSNFLRTKFERRKDVEHAMYQGWENMHPNAAEYVIF